MIAFGLIGLLLGNSNTNWHFIGLFPKKRGGGHLFLNKIVDFGGQKSDILFPNVPKGGGVNRFRK